MPPGSDPLSKAVYRSVLRYARQFDNNMAAKALFQLYGVVKPPANDFSATPADRRLYAAGLEVVVGSRCYVRPERLTWSLQRLIKNVRRANNDNLAAVAEDVTKSQREKGEDGLPVEDRKKWEQDAMAAISLENFFPGSLRGVNRADKIAAGFAALREMSSKWGLANTLGLTGNGPTAVRRKKRKPVRSKRKMTRREMRILRHRERGARQAAPTLFGADVTPTDAPGRGVFLISHPVASLSSPDHVFHRSVVLLITHNDGGSYGLVVNKHRGQTLQETISGEGAPPAAVERILRNPVRTGGPMMPRLAWLHKHEAVGGLSLSEDTQQPVFFCGTMQGASELLDEGGAEPTDFSVVVGASTWASGQLQTELDLGLWIMAKAPASLALEGGKNLWRDMLQAMGGPYAELSRIPHGRRWAEMGADHSPSDWP